MQGRLREYVGGYEDWLRQRPVATATEPVAGLKARNHETSGPRRASYKEKQELLALPGRIETLEAEKQRLQDTVASPDFYKEPADAIARTLARLETIEQELLNVLARWDELDSLGRGGLV